MVFRNREVISLTPISFIAPGLGFVTENNCVSFLMNFTTTGGNFSISLLQGSVSPLPAENTVLTLPFGRVGVVKQVGTNWSTGGILDVITGPMLPFPMTQETFYAIPNGQTASMINVANSILSGGGGGVVIGGNPAGANLIWQTPFNPLLNNFSYRGTMLQGVQQIANILLSDVVFRKEGVYVIDPGQLCPSTSGGSGFGGGVSGTTLQFTPFNVPQSDIVSVSQTIDYSLDIPSVLNPALLVDISTSLPGTYVYDEQHCQKQPKFTVQAGAPHGSGSTDFVPIPDGWLVDGQFEEWTPAPGSTDRTNPNASVSRYWKVYPSPSSANAMRGIISFKRLIKELKLAANVSSFVASPITATQQQGPQNFQFDNWTSNGGFYGFDSTGGVGGTTVQDIISDQYLTLNNAIVLNPGGGGDSGFGADNFYHIDMELWTFPLVNPVTLPLAPSTNPLRIPRGYAVVTPSQNVVHGLSSGYFNKYLTNYQLINSPRLKTNISLVYRNVMPQVGDQLYIAGLPAGYSNGVRYNDCGRIQSVSMNFGRGGVVLSITAEKYQFVNGLWNTAISPGGARIG